MPKIGSYVQKENKIRAWIAYGMNMAGIRTRKDLAARIGMPESTFSYRFRHPENFNLGDIWQLEKVIGKYEETEV